MLSINDCNISKRDVKYSRINIDNEGKIKIVIPKFLNKKDIINLFNKKKPWIEKNIKKINETKEKITLAKNQILYLGKIYNYYYDDKYKKNVYFKENNAYSGINLLNKINLTKWYKQKAKSLIPYRIEYFAKKHNFKYKKIYIRSQKTKWGSCSSSKNLSFNYKLMKVSINIIDYIILHELTHTKIMNHSKSFWENVEKICPKYKEYQNWLNDYGLYL